MNPKLQSRFETLKATGLLPSPKGPALTLVELTRKENISTTLLARPIQADPVLMARLLKLANTCRSPGARPVLAIRDAIGILGLNTVRGLALADSLMADRQLLVCHAFDYPDFWSRSLARAVAMQALTTLSHLMPSDEAFTLGLLSRVGELGMASLFPDDYARLLKQKASTEAERLDRERETFEFDHADLTAALLNDWGFPQSLIDPVEFHERPHAASFTPGSRTEGLLLTLMLAAKIADICLAAKDRRRALMANLYLMGGKLSIDADALVALCDRIAFDWVEWSRLLDVPSQGLPPFAELLAPPPPPCFEPTANSSAPHESNGFRVLVVDDDRSTRMLLKNILTRVGYLFSEADNGRTGLERARAEHPDLMIVDWVMPEMDGIDLVRTLRETRSGRSIYILLLTALDQEDRLVEAFAAGTDDFIPKPIKANVLKARLLAGQRLVTLQHEIERNQHNLKHFANEFAHLNKHLQDGYKRDIANRKRMELALQGGDLGMWDLNILDRQLTVSERCCTMLGYLPDKMEFKLEKWFHQVHPDDRAAAHASLQAHLIGKTPTYEHEYRLQHKDGQWIWVQDRGRVVERNAKGAPLRVAGTLMDITVRKKTEAELEKHRHHLEELVFSRTSELADARDAAESANRAKSVFLSNVSHELHTPITGIMGMTDLALARATDTVQASLLTKSMQASRQLLSVIDNILDYSRIEADRLVLEESNFNLEQAVETEWAPLDERATHKGLTLTRSIDPVTPAVVWGDGKRIGQIVRTFIDNAIKFSERGTIHLNIQRLESDDQSILLRIEVCDQGIGISHEQQAKLFSAFTQANGALNRKFGGTGLGLAICRRLARLMNGDAGVISKTGQGSTFWAVVRLKQKKPQSMSPPREDACLTLARDYPGARILVADNDPITREVIQIQLEKAGLITDTAQSGLQAVTLAQSTNYAAIFMDIHIDRVGAQDATRMIRETTGGRHTPMIALSPQLESGDKQYIIEAGFDDILVTPFEPDTLFSTLLEALTVRRAG